MSETPEPESEEPILPRIPGDGDEVAGVPGGSAKAPAWLIWVMVAAIALIIAVSIGYH